MRLLSWRSIILFPVILNLLSACKSDNNDSMQPSDGYPLLSSREEIMQVLIDKCVDTIHFQKGEVIADIGAGNGYLEAMLSMYHDSLTFFIQDIDTSVCNQNTINEVVNFYQEVIGRPFTNQFIVVKGTDGETNLPAQSFDKIMMLWTYQYLQNPRYCILDIRDKLKDEGFFYVINPDVDHEYAKTLQTEFGWNASSIEKEISEIIDCGFELIRISRNHDGQEQPFIMVFKKSTP